MLDTQQPSARQIAQLRMAAQAANIPAEVADIAAQASMTADTFTAFAPVAKRMIEMGAILFKGTDNPTMASIEQALNDADDADLEKLEKAIVANLNAAWADSGENLPRHGRPTENNFVRNSWDHGQGFVAKMSAGLAARLNPKEATAMGRDAAQFSLAEIAMQSCRNAGLRPFDQADAIRMATHTTSDFPLILDGAISNDVARQIEQRMPDLVRASHEVAREDYRAGNSLSLSSSGMPQEVAEGGEIQFVTMEEKGEALPTVRDFASGFNLSNQAMQNDSTAVRLLASISGKMTEGAVERLRHVLLAPIEANSGTGQLMADGLPMFHADHGNLAGTGATVSITSLTDARLSMRKQRGLKGELRPVEPWALVVPAELETAAQQVVAQINAAKSADVNPFSGSLEIIVEPGLNDAAAWYLIGNPTRYAGLAHAFLDGQRMPRVESRAGWNTLGLEFRLTWAMDAKFIETATWFRNPGQ